MGVRPIYLWRKKVASEVKAYDLETHLKKGSDKTRELFKILQETIFNLGEVAEKYLQYYVAYRIPNSRINFVTIHFNKEMLLVCILVPTAKISEPKKVSKAIPESFELAKNLRKFVISEVKEIPRVIELIRQSYEFNRS